MLLNLKKNYFEVLIFVAYAFLGILAVLYHEPWRDEAQAWLIARDLNSREIINQMSFEGTPALWHFLLFIPAKLNLPYFSEQIIHFLIALLSVYLFLFFSPFSKTTKFCFVFSYYMAFEYLVLARNYNLTILLLFLIAIFYNKRFKKPIIYALFIFLLANTNLHSLAISFALMIIFALEIFGGFISRLIGRLKNLQYSQALKVKHQHQNREKIKPAQIIALIIMTLGIAACFYQCKLWKQAPNKSLLRKANYSVLLPAVRNAFFPDVYSELHPNRSYYGALNSILSIIAILLLIIFTLSLPKNCHLKIMFLLPLFWFFFIFVYEHPGGLRHHGLILMLIIFIMWIAKDAFIRPADLAPTKKDASLSLPQYFLKTLNVTLLISIIATLKIHCLDYQKRFSASKAMAQYLIEKRLNDNFMIAHQSPTASAVLPYLPNKKQFWYADIKEEGSFVTWNDEQAAGNYLNNEELLSRSRQILKPKQDALLLLTYPIEQPQAHNLELIHQETGAFGRDENYFLYLII